MKKSLALTLKLWVVQTLGIRLRHRGVVEKYDYTFGGAGNQWTTIGGEVYATYWNYYDKDWVVGDTVDFTIFREPLLGRYDPVFQARDITKVKDKNTSNPFGEIDPEWAVAT